MKENPIPYDLRTTWEKTCDLLSENLEKESEVFPLRKKTPQYDKAVYHWAKTNKKIVATFATTPVYLLVNDSTHSHPTVLSFHDEKTAKLCVPVFFSKEQAQKFSQTVPSIAERGSIVQSPFLALFAPYSRCHTLLTFNTTNDTLSQKAFIVPSDAAIMFCDDRDGKQPIVLEQSKIEFILLEALRHSPFPVATTTVIQDIHCIMDK